MAFVRAVDLFCYRVMGYLRDIRVAVPARYVPVCRVCVDVLINVVNSFYPKFVDPTDLTVLVSH